MRPLVRYRYYLIVVFWFGMFLRQILSYRNFCLQVGESPLLTGMEKELSLLIPLAEFITGLLLVFKWTRLIALYASLGLLALFSTYLLVVFHYNNSYIPCD